MVDYPRSLWKISNMSNNIRKQLVTYALPYANGSLHLGHMVGFIQTDIWVRFQRLLGHNCYFVSGDDAHGTPIMLRAEALGITPEELVRQIQIEHEADLKDFLIGLDNFYTTHSTENQALASDMYQRLQKQGDIVKRTIKQAFDPVKNMFLPDRYVKGECPKCHAKDQYGDSCEQCGATYTPTDLINATSVVSGATPIEKESEHYFFCLEKHEEFLKEWTHHNNHLQPEITKKLEEWFSVGLNQWNISRDAPYFGFEIPETRGKYFYVWLDAPIGYMASFKNLCQKTNGLSFEEYWAQSSHTELYHFIGKDIVYFHALFWPAILKSSEYRTPSHVFVHGFLTVNGQKMSKSRGTFIKARTYLDHFNPELLRYYIASKLNSGIEDLDFQQDDFVARINSDLVGKLVNIASRTASFINKLFAGRLAATIADHVLWNRFTEARLVIEKHYQDREFSRAIREIMKLTDLANQYIDDHKPWLLAKSSEKINEVQMVCSFSLDLFRILMTYLQPILPTLAKAVEDFLNVPLTWENLTKPLLNHTINPFKPLLQRIDLTEVIAMSEESKEVIEPATEITLKTTVLEEDPIRETITLEDFAKIDLRVAKVIQAEPVEDAQKLIKLVLDVGGEIRHVFAGIKECYEPEQLIGKSVVLVANLAPRKMRFGVSEGMILAAGNGGKNIWVLEPDPNAPAGARVK